MIKSSTRWQHELSQDNIDSEIVNTSLFEFFHYPSTVIKWGGTVELSLVLDGKLVVYESYI